MKRNTPQPSSFVTQFCAALCVVALITSSQVATAQNAPETQASQAAATCEPEQALALVRAQASEAGKIEDTAQRVQVLVRAADLLWRNDEQAARALFTQSYEAASAEMKKEPPPAARQMFEIVIRRADLRLEVLRRVAARDAKWAQKLAEIFSKDATREAEDRMIARASQSARGELSSDVRTEAGAVLLGLASSLLETNEAAAMRAVLVEETDFRALLMLEIAAERIKINDDKPRAAELLENVRSLALKADATNERARALLGVTHAYAKFDAARAFEALRDAVKSIDQTENLDLTSSVVHRRIKGRDFAIFTSYPVPAFNIENVFRELSRKNFNEATVGAQAIRDRYLRATALLAASAACLETLAKPDAEPAL